jgi:pimeloyl-ACP methyl ester carboxylesterase
MGIIPAQGLREFDGATIAGLSPEQLVQRVHALAGVTAPTLLIVGGNDHAVIEMNVAALQQLHCTKRLDIVPGASHLFEEKGTLEHVAGLARDWFIEYL